jgi:cyclophilin family peptidyl-prolyl cis-trans isomerase
MLLFSSCLNKTKNITNSSIAHQFNKARLKTVYGDIVFTFYNLEAPRTTERVKKLISDGFYNGLSFHRVIPGLIAQTGKPIGTGIGSGHLLKAEFNDLEHIAGSVSMARNISDLNSADSQFFFTLVDQPDFNGKYTVFAKISSGLDTLKKIKQDDKIILLILE